MNIEIGTDIISVSRISKAIERFGIRFLERFLLPSEIILALKDKSVLQTQSKVLYCLASNICDIKSNTTGNKRCDMPKFFTQEHLNKNTQATHCILKTLRNNFLPNAYRMETIAGFWAVKEACAKALGTGIGVALGFHDICIAKDCGGKPYILLHESVWHEFYVHKISVSISHDANTTVAVCAVILKQN